MNGNRMKVSDRYSYEIKPSSGTAAEYVIELVGNNKAILELGPGPGSILRPLVEQHGCVASSVEIDPECAEQLRAICLRVVCADLEADDWVDALADEKYDVVVMADVLEHLRDPWQCLRRLKPLLRPEGRIIISMPNVAHHSIVASLLSGRFPYQERGLLDITHLRFFGRTDLEEMLLECGFVPSAWRFAKQPPAKSELRCYWDRLPAAIRTSLDELPAGDVYQHIVEAYPSNEVSYVAYARKEKTKLENDLSLLKETEQLHTAKISELLIQYEQLNQLLEKSRNEAQTKYLKVIGNGLLVSAQQVKKVFSKMWRILPLSGIVPLVKRLTSRLLLILFMCVPQSGRNVLKRVQILQYIRRRLVIPYVVTTGSLECSKFIDLQPNAKPDVLIWGVIDWYLRFQRPQQLAMGFANAGHRVIYISSELLYAPTPSFVVEKIGGEGQVFQVHLMVPNPVAIYSNLPCDNLVHALRLASALMLEQLGAPSALSIVQHPFWLDVAQYIPLSALIYDCMDHHAGFENTAEMIILEECRLMQQAQLMVVTSSWLEGMARQKNENVAVIRNAGDFSHFSQRPDSIYRDLSGRKILGYYGAIAEWFDIKLIRKVANRFSDCTILLIGSDTVGAQAALSDIDNIKFTGEVPYAKLPFYLYAFDVCLLPFKVIELTLATNPVKVYEYLGAGKPVVCVDLPEVQQFGDLVYAAASQEDFLDCCAKAMEEGNSQSLIDARRKFASNQTWLHRAIAFDQALTRLHQPKVSVVVLTYNNLHLTRRCLQSLLYSDPSVEIEIILVDNASHDGTPAYLQMFSQRNQNCKLILSPENIGFSAGNNLGLKVATGDYIVVLNNDTVVTNGWALKLIRHLKNDPSIGLIGPVTNNIGNEAKIDIFYPSLEVMPQISREYTNQHWGELTQLRTLAFFCVMMPRNVYEKIGGLDEAFGLGFFEDDDYCRRVQLAGWRCVCAEDVFVHHNLSASFNKLGEARKAELMEKNKALYERKWGKWVPHTYRNGV